MGACLSTPEAKEAPFIAAQLDVSVHGGSKTSGIPGTPLHKAAGDHKAPLLRQCSGGLTLIAQVSVRGMRLGLHGPRRRSLRCRGVRLW